MSAALANYFWFMQTSILRPEAAIGHLTPRAPRSPRCRSSFVLPCYRSQFWVRQCLFERGFWRVIARMLTVGDDQTMIWHSHNFPQSIVCSLHDWPYVVTIFANRYLIQLRTKLGTPCEKKFHLRLQPDRLTLLWKPCLLEQRSNLMLLFII